jgi:hypothetical protein
MNFQYIIQREAAHFVRKQETSEIGGCGGDCHQGRHITDGEKPIVCIQILSLDFTFSVDWWMFNGRN